MSDDFVPERHLGLWTEEGRSDWSAVLWRGGGGLYSVTLERGAFDRDVFGWVPTCALCWGQPTRERALQEAAEAISRMVDNLLVIRASLRGDPDEVEP